MTVHPEAGEVVERAWLRYGPAACESFKQDYARGVDLKGQSAQQVLFGGNPVFERLRSRR